MKAGATMRAVSTRESADRRALRAVALLAAVSLWGASAGTASAQGIFMHAVQEGDTLSSIAQRYYGDPNLAVVLASENRVGGREVLLAGTKIAIPFVSQHRVDKGETWGSLAERYYGDPGRTFLLMQANRKVRRRLDPGTLLRIPYPVRAIVRAGETPAKVAERFGVTRGLERRWLRRFNPNARFTAGERVLVPLGGLVLSTEGAALVEKALRAALPDDGARERQLEADNTLRRMKALLKEGAFAEVIAVGNSLLGGGALSSLQKVAVFWALAESYVAFARADLATAAFRSALAIDPTLELDEVQTSPKVLEAFRAAR